MARGADPSPPRQNAPDSLRTALSGLTTRGRSFLAAGCAAGLCSYLLGHTDLLRVGLLLAALPLVSVLALHFTRHRVTGSRGLAPHRVAARSEARVYLRVENVSRLPTGLLMLQDQVPYVLGPRPRFVLDRMEPGGRREVSYRVRSDLRGHYPLGPLQLRLTDPFGMCELTRSFHSSDCLVVVPKVEPLPAVRLPGEASGFGDGRPRSLALAGEDDVIPRGYRYGDDLRRVHWRSTARYGELMVRREEQQHRAHCTVLLDTRRAAYPGSGPDSPFEWAVTAAASVVVHLLARGYAVRLLTDAGTLTSGADGGPGSVTSDTAGALLDALSVIDHSPAPGLERARDVLRDGRQGMLIALLGTLDEEQTALVAQMRRSASGGIAVLVRAQRRPERGERQARAAASPVAAAVRTANGVPAGDAATRRVLGEAGWTVLGAEPGTALATVWQQAETGDAAYDTGPPGGPGAPGEGP